MNGSTIVQFIGANAADFTATELPDTIAAGSGASIQITFTPAGTAAHRHGATREQ